ncbi:aminopeptidase P family protein [Streptomyces netropsis]|uniref:Xaa-Pro aminopeptidase n=1 Tax=Streptomyces netropsis TaxID=55404 RepID=A0A7W7PGA0_STRNE|nr:aminopeptidase P family protein [Streptomyces netropsis]MBB4888617.1 Xaa-Pro aminopeptidase [Streptomyces netropsis]GGR13864.1 dipeptidase [Streptomyces netropsis]
MTDAAAVAPGSSDAPVDPKDYAARMERAALSAADAGLAGLIVTPGPDLVWLTGYSPPTTERLTVLLVAPGRRPQLLVPALERPDAERAPGARALAVSGWTDGEDPYALMVKLLEAKGRYGVSDNAWALHLLALQRNRPEVAYGALTEVLPMLRAVKDAYEVERLAAAGAAADATYEQIVGVRFAGRREYEVAADLARLLREHGHSQVDFTIVGSGPNGANPHHDAGERMIEDGDMVVLDFGGLKDGYGSDTTRTVHVGEPTREERTVHDLVREAQQAAFEAVRPGVACQEIDRVARQVIRRAGYGEYFIHRTGHGIGVTTHEPPYLVEGEHLPLVPGMCFSIEPGIYLPGRFGVRIEDIVTCTETGGRRLNNTARELRVVA